MDQDTFSYLVEIIALKLIGIYLSRLSLLLGLATFSVRRINNQQGTQTIVEIKCPLSGLGSDLHAKIAQSLDIVDASRVKCISLGRIIDPDRTLEAQGLKNNQQLMVIISEVDKTAAQNHEDAMYDRIRKIKMDVEAIVDSSQQLFEVCVCVL